ncbi:MAG: hypothetical protein AABW46_00605 [Nanoarchaeota archaeon]
MRLSRLQKAGIGLVSLVASLTAGCSGFIEGSRSFARTREQDLVLRGLATSARHAEANERAKNTGLRGNREIAGAIRDSNMGYVNNSSQGYNVNNFSGNNLSDNPLTWDVDDAVINGELVAFSKIAGGNVDEHYKREVFIMRNDGSNLKRLTFNKGSDAYARWVDEENLMWLFWGDFAGHYSYGKIRVRNPDFGKIRIMNYNLRTGRTSVIEERQTNFGLGNAADLKMLSDLQRKIQREGYTDYIDN